MKDENADAPDISLTDVNRINFSDDRQFRISPPAGSNAAVYGALKSTERETVAVPEQSMATAQARSDARAEAMGRRPMRGQSLLPEARRRFYAAGRSVNSEAIFPRR
jgi:hypothetical protein